MSATAGDVLRRRRKLEGAAVLSGLAALVLALGPGYAWTHGFLPRCLLHELTGLHCSGCGSQRAIHSLFAGDVTAAFGYNALLVLALPFLLYAGLRTAGEGWFGWRLPRVPLRASTVWAVLAGILLFTVARNLPVPPFTRLAP